MASPDAPARAPLLARLTARLPAVWGVGALPHALATRYTRADRPPVRARLRGLDLVLRPTNDVETSMLFGPQFYDRRELDFLESQLRPGDTFLDVGCYVGVYALVAARRVGPKGRVIAVEMDPRNVQRIRGHARDNGIHNLEVVHAGASDADTDATVHLNDADTTPYNSVLAKSGTPTKVPLRTLATICRDAGIERVAGMKLDVEGMEARVLHAYFANQPSDRDPRFLLVEQSGDWTAEGASDPTGAILGRGYEQVGGYSHNRFYVKR